MSDMILIVGLDGDLLEANDSALALTVGDILAAHVDTDPNALPPMVIGASFSIEPRASLVDNVFLGHELSRFGLVRRAEQKRRTADLLSRLGLDRAPATLAGALDATEQLLVVVAQALLVHPSDVYVVGDSLSESDAGGPGPRVRAALDLLTEAGIRVTIVGGDLAALAPLASSVIATSSRGAFAGRVDARAGGVSAAELSAALDLAAGADTPAGDRHAGPAQPTLDPPGTSTATAAADPTAPALRVSGWSITQPLLKRSIVADGCSFDAVAGEILVLVGRGANELLMSLFAGQFGQRTSGSIRVDDTDVTGLPIDKTVAAGLVLGTERPLSFDVGVIGGIPTNVSPSSLAKLARWGFIDTERDYSARRPAPLSEALSALRNHRQSPESYTDMLAGWVAPETAAPRVILLDEPLLADAEKRLAVIRELRDAGRCVVVATARLDDAEALADRVIVVRAGRVAARLAPPHVSRGSLLRALSAVDSPLPTSTAQQRTTSTD